MWGMEAGKMTIADTSTETIGSLFFKQVRDVTVSAARKNNYKSQLGILLESYAPESSRLYRQRLAAHK